MYLKNVCASSCSLAKVITTKFSPPAVVKIFICYLHFDIPPMKNLFLELFYWNFTKKKFTL